MANGCAFRAARLTAASRTLPLGSVVRVTRLHPPRSVVVEITDRGPYVSGRIIDMSRGAAEVLDMIATGIVAVSIEPLTVRHSVGCRHVG